MSSMFDQRVGSTSSQLSIEDLMVFDNDTLRRMLAGSNFGLTPERLAHCLHKGPSYVVERIERYLPLQQRSCFLHELRRPLAEDEAESACQEILHALFWEFTYWKTPEFYDELIAGEQLHPGIFQQLQPDIHGSTVLDVGAGSGRATVECLRCGAKRVYAVEPSPGLLHLLECKRVRLLHGDRIIPLAGRFDALPLEENSVDITLSCSAFTAQSEQGGEPGLAEMKRVTKPGGKVVVIWPRTEDSLWLLAHGFHYVALPLDQHMCIYFRSMESALHCVEHFYAGNPAVVRYLLSTQRPEIPFSILGVNPPRDYCWLEVS